MKYRIIINTLEIVKNFMKNCISDGSIALDCTVGNGNDTLLLAKLVGSSGKVYGFDIQNLAIENTRNLLNEHGFNDRVNLIKDSHENIDLYINEKVDFIVYNLGYLPKGDKNIKTNKISTIISLNKALQLLNKNGLIVITVYTGHNGGIEEKEAIEEFLKKLDQRLFNVLKFDFINQINNPPILYCLEKR
jgi:tRNA A58 N-methylase Trm61